MTTPWNPYAHQPPGGGPAPYGPDPYGPDPSAARDERWWVPSVLCTLLAPLLAYIDRTTTPGGDLPAVWALGYLVPFALVVSTWLLARTVRRRRARIVLGALGCLLAYLYTEAVMAVLLGVVFVRLLAEIVQGIAQG
ncbi:hypothetical protein ACWF94_06770 [Streptomyces sp. NPDC055078]